VNDMFVKNPLTSHQPTNQRFTYNSTRKIGGNCDQV